MVIMQTPPMHDAARSGTLAIVLLALCAFAGAAERAPLPGASGPPQVEIGKVNVFGIDELPPAMQEEARRALRLQLERARAGVRFDAVDDEDWQWPAPPEQLFPSFATMNQGRVLIRPRDLAQTSLAGLRFLGLEDNTARPGEPVLTIAREFQRPDGIIIELVENELDGRGAAVMVRELIHDWVGPWPAVFSVQRAPSGRVRSVLDWADNGTDFTLMVLDDVRRPRASTVYDKAWMFDLARQIEAAPRAGPGEDKH
jgi:hypothetical protein